jgi:hypothetical protein
MILVFQSENRKTPTICQNIFYNIPVEWFQMETAFAAARSWRATV